MEEIRDFWYLYLIGSSIIGIIVAVTKQFMKVNYVNKEQDRLKEMFGRWQDKSQSQYDKISDELSELKGSFNTFFQMWIKKNGE